jgi:predicted permease
VPPLARAPPPTQPPARATRRTRATAERAATGGTRGRIIRQLLTESMVLSTIGGLFGLAFGMVGMRALLAVNTAGLPRVGEGGVFVAFDWRVAAFTMAIALGTGFVFGLIPALQGSRADLTTSLKETSGRSGTGLRQNVSRSLLVVTEVALALVLLLGSARLIRTSIALANVDPGFDTTNVLTMQTSLAGPEFATAAGVALVVRNGVERLRAVPGVEDATSACCVPLQGGYGLPFVIQGRPLEGPFHGGGAWVTISPGYFEVFKIPIKRGRSLTERDDAGGAPVVLINEAMARQFWPDGDPLNDRLVIGRGVMREFAAEPERQIIGIVGDTRDGGLNADPQPRMFVPQAQIPDAASALNTRLTPLAWMVRTRSSSQAMTSSVTEALREATGIPVSNVRLMSDVVSLSTSRQRFNMWLMTVFGASALLLAAIGIYGLMAYSVAQRTQEIGIRLALGAQAATVRNMVIWQGMRLSFIGGAVGVGAAFFLARYIQQFLFEVQPWDPVAFVVVPITLLAVTFVAVSLPALRASHVDPLDALRGE